MTFKDALGALGSAIDKLFDWYTNLPWYMQIALAIVVLIIIWRILRK